MEHHASDYGGYMPHGMCLLWEPWLVLLWAGSDLLIFLSYTAIPIALFMVISKRTEVPQPALVGLFGAFILLCGITHLFMIVTLWVPIYPFVGWIKLATGLVSMATAIMLFRLVPDIIRLPSPAALELANRGLQAEIAAHKMTLASLDQQVKERTAELQQATAALAVHAREAAHRSSNLLSVVHTLALQSAKGAEKASDFLPTFLGRVRALADATRSIADEDHSRAQVRKVVEAGLALLTNTYGDRVSYSGPPLVVSPTAAQYLSLALHELGTNTHKYGLGASDHVRLEVIWAINDANFEFFWREHGGEAAPDADVRGEGFGTVLLTNIVPAALGGTAERRFESGELIYRLEVPLRAIGDSGTPDRAALADQIIDTNFRA
jgi:two-component sensor histidine kinase